MYTDQDAVNEVLIGSETHPVTVGAGNASDLSAEQFTDAIQNAQNQVNAYLSTQYTVPFPDGSVPSLVHSITTDIAAYLCDLNYRGAAGREYSNTRSPLYLRYDRALSLLKGLSNGSLTLPPGDGGGEGDSGASGVSVVNTLPELFTGQHIFEDASLQASESRVTYGDW